MKHTGLSMYEMGGEERQKTQVHWSSESPGHKRNAKHVYQSTSVLKIGKPLSKNSSIVRSVGPRRDVKERSWLSFSPLRAQLFLRFIKFIRRPEEGRRNGLKGQEEELIPRQQSDKRGLNPGQERNRCNISDKPFLSSQEYKGREGKWIHTSKLLLLYYSFTINVELTYMSLVSCSNLPDIQCQRQKNLSSITSFIPCKIYWL